MSPITHKTKTRKDYHNMKLHTTYGGRIYQTDFNTCYSTTHACKESSIAARIASDMRFDEMCRNNIEARANLQTTETISL